MQILLVEDEDTIAEPLAEGLRREGFDVERAATGAEALAAPEADLVLLDLRLPDMDGLDVCRRLRERSQVPIIIVTARGEEADRVVGLELGADDYVVKPFGVRELIARIRAVTRRTTVAVAKLLQRRIALGPGIDARDADLVGRVPPQRLVVITERDQEVLRALGARCARTPHEVPRVIAHPVLKILFAEAIEHSLAC